MESVLSYFPSLNWFLLFRYRRIIHRTWRRVSKLKHYPVALYECEVYDDLMVYLASVENIAIIFRGASGGRCWGGEL